MAGLKTPDQLTAALLDETVDLMFRMYLVRGKCSAAAQATLEKNKNHALVEDYARLDDALAECYRALQVSIRKIQRSRAKRRRKASS